VILFVLDTVGYHPGQENGPLTVNEVPGNRALKIARFLFFAISKQS
jgi:hypothetical protein